LEHYSEDGENYEEAIADLMETRQVSTQILSFFIIISNKFKKIYRISYFSYSSESFYWRTLHRLFNCHFWNK